LRARVSESSTLATRDLDPVLQLLRESLSRTLDDLSTFHAVVADSFASAVVLDAYTDVVHRALFGLVPSVNEHRHRVRKMPVLAFGMAMQTAIDEAGDGEFPPARTALVDAAREVFVARGFHGTRVDDIVEAAGVSHGAFYRYFRNKDEIAGLLAARAMRTVSVTLAGIPDLVDADASVLRRWLRQYNEAQVGETAMIRVWIEAALQGDGLRADSAAVLDWGRRRMAKALRSRPFSDPDVDGLLLLAVLDTFGRVERPQHELDAAVLVVERGFLGR
jgi:AcrR family transcriptional regulator